MADLWLRFVDAFSYGTLTWLRLGPPTEPSLPSPADLAELASHVHSFAEAHCPKFRRGETAEDWKDCSNDAAQAFLSSTTYKGGITRISR